MPAESMSVTNEIKCPSEHTENLQENTHTEVQFQESCSATL